MSERMEYEGPPENYIWHNLVVSVLLLTMTHNLDIYFTQALILEHQTSDTVVNAEALLWHLSNLMQHEQSIIAADTKIATQSLMIISLKIQYTKDFVIKPKPGYGLLQLENNQNGEFKE